MKKKKPLKLPVKSCEREKRAHRQALNEKVQKERGLINSSL
jgi:hypothetical protein